jgi:hypothetical protein
MQVPGPRRFVDFNEAINFVQGWNSNLVTGNDGRLVQGSFYAYIGYLGDNWVRFSTIEH